MDGLDILHCVADGSEVLPESLLRDNDRASAVVGMEGERGGILETAVEEENDMMVSIIDESERTDRTGFESQIAHHPSNRVRVPDSASSVRAKQTTVCRVLSCPVRQEYP